MCLIFLADKKPASLSADFLMRCCNRLSDFTSLLASYPELQGTTVLDVYAACGIGACASALSKQLESGSALLQDHFTAFISRILPALILRQHFDAAERVRLSLAVFLIFFGGHFELIAVSFSLRSYTCCHNLVQWNPPCLISCCCSTSSTRMSSIKVSQTCIFRWLWALLPQPLLRYTASILPHRMNAVLWFETFVPVLYTKF